MHFQIKMRLFLSVFSGNLFFLRMETDLPATKSYLSGSFCHANVGSSETIQKERFFLIPSAHP